jgi:hypothetical protein
MPSSTDRDEPQVIELPRVQAPLTVPGVFELAKMVDDWAQDIKEPCDQLRAALAPYDQDLSQDDELMVDPVAARRLSQHVPDLIDIPARVSNLAIFIHVLRTLLDIERRHATVR